MEISTGASGYSDEEVRAFWADDDNFDLGDPSWPDEEAFAASGEGGYDPDPSPDDAHDWDEAGVVRPNAPIASVPSVSSHFLIVPVASVPSGLPVSPDGSFHKELSRFVVADYFKGASGGLFCPAGTVDPRLGTVENWPRFEIMTSSASVSDVFANVSGGLCRAQSKGRFVYTADNMHTLARGTISRGGEVLARFGVATGEGCLTVAQGKGFVGTFMRILNGDDKDPDLRLFRPYDFGFLVSAGKDYFKAGREGGGSSGLFRNVEAVYFDRTGRLQGVFKKAFARTLIRASLDHWEGELPQPTRVKKHGTRAALITHRHH